MLAFAIAVARSHTAHRSPENIFSPYHAPLSRLFCRANLFSSTVTSPARRQPRPALRTLHFVGDAIAFTDLTDDTPDDPNAPGCAFTVFVRALTGRPAWLPEGDGAAARPTPLVRLQELRLSGPELALPPADIGLRAFLDGMPTLTKLDLSGLR